MSVATPYRLSAPAGPPTVRQTQLSLVLSLSMFAAYVFLARLEPELRYTRYVLPAALATLWLARRAQERRLALLTALLSTYAAMTAAVCAWSAVAIGASPFFVLTLLTVGRGAG